ncbi:uncharacterized protein LOC120779748 isoform X1 [Bactrocera tryoni]|uniref:uncharacterized protein LOC120779748 isoform X1 n=1 Tax=Bactrocera tryoni TaxID=59916 RepID=UPI001A974A45|nr:uncharacterized protein LOC120779748 isoform X1 [Bactrocera tryoni]
MPTERSPDELETCRCRTVQTRWMPWTGKFWSFFPATWWTVMGSLRKLVCRQLLKWSMFPLRMRVMLLPTLGWTNSRQTRTVWTSSKWRHLKRLQWVRCLRLCQTNSNPNNAQIKLGGRGEQSH